MDVYISGIMGTGMGPLAMLARDAGYYVCGSDVKEGAVSDDFYYTDIEVDIGEQDGSFLREKIAEGVRWFVYTSALPEDHPELKIAREAGLKCTKRDEFTQHLVDMLGMKMIAVAGTHGKTTTAAMIIWTTIMLELPVAYIVGTTLEFAPCGAYTEGDKYFVYEADEYDRNFLKFHPWLSIITNISYDHPDIYKKPRDYRAAFLQFKAQSDMVIDDDSRGGLEAFTLAGEARRKDAKLALLAIMEIYKDRSLKGERFDMEDIEDAVTYLNDFPGAGRRFERLTDGVYTDYAHHPEEIAATMNVAREEMYSRGKKGVVVVYQPHQNTRQHEVKDKYVDAFKEAEKVFWLPTYLTRENSELEVLKPEDFIKGLSNAKVAEPAELNDELEKKLRNYLVDDYLVILMTAGPADEWFRQKFAEKG